MTDSLDGQPAAGGLTPSPSDPPARGKGAIEVANVSDGGFFYWLLRFYAFGLMALVGLGACFALGTYVYFAAT
ncbi:MAG: hypothetical protein ABUS79_04585, partial [Pseudomonadota bacterium]